MRRIVQSVSLLSFLALAVIAHGQAARPQFRPAVLKSGAESLVNQINVEELSKKGQENGAVMFCAAISKTGDVLKSWTYRGTPGSDALEQEVVKQLQTVKFTPAIYNHQPVEVLLFATVAFSEAKPHLRILLNQDPKELRDAKDFIGPQPVSGGDSKFTGLHPPTITSPEILSALVGLEIKVDASGNLKEMQVLNEEPPSLGFADAALSDFREAKFVPAFRDGDPTEAQTVLPVCYKLAPTE